MTEDQAPVIYWVRRDLRITDNTALLHASSTGAAVIPLYFLSQWKNSHSWTGPKRQKFLCDSLVSFSKNLESLGGRLIIRQGSSVCGLDALIQETGARAVYFNRDPDPFGKESERQVATICEKRQISYHGYQDAALHAPDEVLTLSAQPYRVYTPFSRNWLSLDKPSACATPKSIRTPANLTSDPLPDLSHWALEPASAALLEAGERAARLRLKHAISHIVESYDAKRNFPSLDGTSRISQDLRFGLISIRTIYAAAVKARATASAIGQAGIDTFIKELAWREFYFAILHHYPNVLDEEFNPDWRGLPWDEPNDLLERWKTGQTGFPIVDAGMRELLATGFMHNRVRMITAMFLTKDLHIDWRLGESHFMQHLIDGEIASNNGGWQWSAGTGADAAPYFRIQNPWSQTLRYDPNGIYIKRWIPELKQVDPAHFVLPPQDGKPIAAGYPPPCVDHGTERERTLAIFKRHKQSLDR